MEKIYGAQARQDCLMQIGTNKFEIIYGFGKDNENDETGWNYRQRFSHRPSLDEIKSVINAQIDADVDESTMNGMKWNGMPVCLDAEFQTNVLGILAVLSLKGDSLFPKMFKLGNYPDGTPAFHTFTTALEFADFADALMSHKEACYKAGWQQKQILNDGDWSAYKDILL